MRFIDKLGNGKTRNKTASRMHEKKGKKNNKVKKRTTRKQYVPMAKNVLLAIATVHETSFGAQLLGRQAVTLEADLSSRLHERMDRAKESMKFNGN